ncbi:MAG: sugar phosphate isomerase/epimerase [Lentisphaeria bacterium]|nr:sugar phosphate isomerase/epimerase [Lentisphaeria bacterium]
MKKFSFLICPNAIPCADFSQFINAASKTRLKDISVRPAWIPFDGIEKTDLRLSCIGNYGNFADKALQEELYTVMETAEKYNIPLINIASDPNINTADQRSSADFFRDAAACAKEKNLVFTMETYGVMTRTAEECLRLVDRVNHEWFQICYDTANVWRFAPEFKTGEDLTNDFRKLKGMIGHMHLKDFEPETKTITVLGKGEVDFPAIFSLLEDWGFDGIIGLDLETTRACKINTVAAHEEELKLSLEYLESLNVIK